jgi:hypothetical protein
VTTAVFLPGERSCAPDANCFDVTLNSFLSRPATAVTLVVDATSPSRTLSFSDLPPPASGLTSSYGIRNFGDVGAGGSSTREISFIVPNLDPYIVVFSLWEQDTASVPANDEPVGAVGLTAGIDFAANAIVGSNVGATASQLLDPTTPAPGCAAYSGSDVWFSVIVPASGNLTLETDAAAGSTLLDTGLAIYSGTPGGLALEACDDDSGNGFFTRIDLSGRTPGETLYVRGWEYAGGTQDTFQISAWEFVPPPAPANDDANAAVALTFGPDFATNAIVGTKVGATASQVADPSIPAPGCASYAGGDVWYSVVVPANGILSLATDVNPGSTLTDTGLAVYSGALGSFAFEGCDDDSGNGFASQLDLTGRTPGETLFVRVWEFGGGTQDTFQVSAFESPPPPPPSPPANDDPSFATLLTAGADFPANAATGTNVAATASELADPSIPDPGCGGYSGGDVWFSVVVPSDGVINLETGAAPGSTLNDTGLAVYSSSMGLTLEGCNDDSSGFFSRVDLTGRTPGETLFVRVWAFGNSAADTFEVSAWNRRRGRRRGCGRRARRARARARPRRRRPRRAGRGAPAGGAISRR